MSNKNQPKESNKYGSRLREMTAVLRKHGITGGLTPEKLRLILEDLGPTYIKLGQIMSLHSDILPKSYCEELMRLHSEVTPMPFEQVAEVIRKSYGYEWNEVFQSIDVHPLGSASIAQVHRAVLKTGEDVVVKVQRQGIYKVMSRDISLLHKAAKLVPPGTIKDMVDINMVLDELWTVTQQEMNFLLEAASMEEFAQRNQDVAFVTTPRLYREYTTNHVLVMEYIDGFAINDKENLLANGYDLNEIGTKLVDNYIRQVMEDGFFHADPHPGNVRIRDGKIVWIDMGMMGRLTERDREQISNAVKGVAENDIGLIQEAVMALGEFRGKPDQSKLYEDINNLMAKYGTIDILVNNAGIGRLNKAPQDTSLKEWEKVIDINVNGSFICAKAVGKVMLKNRKGKIINMSSISGKVINKGVHGGSYDVSKQAIDGLTRALAAEWAQYNINVNAIAPGYFMTDPNKEFFAADPDFYDVALGMIPAGKMANPEDLAGTLIYLASGASNYVHGTIIQVDGGYMVW